MSASIVVVGSLNMDFVVAVKQLPAPGETVLGSNFQVIPGGKGANQACAAGRLVSNQARVRMIGRVGQDLFGDHLKASLSAAGVDVSAVAHSRTQPTGVALISVEGSGENSIVVASGANMDLPASDVEAMRRVLRGARVALFQLESPLDTVAAALRVAREERVLTILDPAPAQPLSRELLESVDILTPNESEALGLLGERARRIEAFEAANLATRVLGLGPRTVILKLGEQGAFLQSASESRHFPGFKVNPVDTTAAGDTFNAALAVALAEDRAMPEAIRFANAAAAISVTRMGAQASAPTRTEVNNLAAP